MSSDEISGAEAHSRFTAGYFQRRIEQHGATFEALEWKDEASQALRFEVLCGIGLGSGDVVWDVGCGNGDLLAWIKTHVASAVSYVGIDPVEEFVEAARRRRGDGRFVQADALSLERLDLPRPDVVMISGIFNLLGPQHEEFHQAVVRGAFAVARRGVAYNRMSDRVDFRNQKLAYGSPEETLQFGLSLTRRVCLRHDYPLFEFTVYLRH